MFNKCEYSRVFSTCFIVLKIPCLKKKKNPSDIEKYTWTQVDPTSHIIMS